MQAGRSKGYGSFGLSSDPRLSEALSGATGALPCPVLLRLNFETSTTDRSIDRGEPHLLRSAG